MVVVFVVVVVVVGSYRAVHISLFDLGTGAHMQLGAMAPEGI